MKRHYTKDEEGEEDEKDRPPYAVGGGSHAGMQRRKMEPRGSVNATRTPLASAAGDLRALCGRLHDGTASVDDMLATMRLANGAHIGTAPIVVGGGDQTPGVDQKCAALVVAYEALWSNLDDGAVRALLARRRSSGWPPTFGDVERAYVALAPCAAPAHVARIQSDPSGDVVRAAQRLGHALGDAAHTQEAARATARGPFAETWAPVFDRSDAGHLRDCAPHARYTIVVVRRFDGDTVVLLRATGGDRPMTALLHVETRDALPLDDARLLVLAPVPPALAIYGDALGLFLAALSDRRARSDVDDGSHGIARLLSPTPAGLAQVKAALGPRRGLPASAADTVRRFFPAAVALDAHAPVRWLDLGECQLVLALRLFAGQVVARRAVATAQSGRSVVPPSLVDIAAAAYRGPIHAGAAPAEVLDAVAVSTWDRACAAAALPDGTLPEARRLVDVARLWGHEPDGAEAARPELLCAPLALGRDLLAQ